MAAPARCRRRRPGAGSDSLSDFDLEGIGLYGFIEESGEPVVVMRLGSRSPAYIETNPNLDEGTTAAKAKKIQNASVRAANRIARSGRPILSPRQWQGVAKGALWLLLAILYVWYLIAARPSLPALLIAALAVTSAGFLGGQRLARSLNRRFADLQGERVVVNYLTRDQWRERRWNAKRDVIAVGTSVALTALVTVVATYWANGWRPPLP
jgi:hypothetical protein